MSIQTNVTKYGKQELIERSREHRKAKRLAKGVVADFENDDSGYWSFEDTDFLWEKKELEFATGKAAMCAVGCLATPLDKNKFTNIPDDETGYSKLDQEFGIPREISVAADAIFETLPYEQAKYWPQRFSEALPVGRAYVELPNTEEFEVILDIRENGGWDTEDEEGIPESIKAANDLIEALEDALLTY